MERRFETGTVVSAVGHLGVVLWVLVGDWLFPASAPPEPLVMTVSTLTSAEFDALQAASTPNPADEPAPEVPATRPAARPDPQPAPDPVPDPAPAPEPTPAPDPVPEPDPAPSLPPSDLAQADTEQLIETESTDIQPLPEAEDIIAPDPVQPETEAPVSDTPEPAVSEDVAADQVIPQEPTEATAPRDTGDVTRTEANQDQTAETGMATSLRPRAKPSRPAPAPEPTREPDPAPTASAELNVQPVDDQATEDAIAALLGEAVEAPVETPAEPPSTSGGQNRPQGPPLTGGEMDNIASAISRKWNLGASSTDALSSLVVVRVSFAADGTPTNFELIESSGPSQGGISTLYETARRAVNRAHVDGGLPLPADKYDTWRVLDLVFDANGMRAR